MTPLPPIARHVMNVMTVRDSWPLDEEEAIQEEEFSVDRLRTLGRVPVCTFVCERGEIKESGDRERGKREGRGGGAIECVRESAGSDTNKE